MTPLGREIAATIRTDGPMRLDRYMALCLGHPRHGYYATRDPFGARGDFVTAPEISQMFGELIGLWTAEVWRLMGAPARFSLVELGPGRGTLMADLLRAGRIMPGFLDAAEVVLVETSPALREVQARRLEGRDVQWASSIKEVLAPRRHPGRSEAENRDRPPSEAPLQASDPGSAAVAAVRDDAGPLPAIVISNEFFDALPVRQFLRTNRGWRERLVGLGDDGRLVFGLSPEPPSGLALPDAPEGSEREVSPEALAVAAAVATHVVAHGGACLSIDYGYGAGSGDTFQAMKAHRFVDPLETPGEADLTAHVDFAALSAAAARAGAATMKLLPQADFLERLGLAARAERLAAEASPAQREAILAAGARLTDCAPRGMGALFKALAFGDPRLGALPGFEPEAIRP